MQFDVNMLQSLFNSNSILLNSVLNICNSVTHRAYIPAKNRVFIDMFDDRSVGREIYVEGKLYTHPLDTDSKSLEKFPIDLHSLFDIN